VKTIIKAMAAEKDGILLGMLYWYVLVLEKRSFSISNMKDVSVIANSLYYGDRKDIVHNLQRKILQPVY